MLAGADNKLPYGSLPRLLLAWVSTEAVRTQSRDAAGFDGDDRAWTDHPPVAPANARTSALV